MKWKTGRVQGEWSTHINLLDLRLRREIIMSMLEAKVQDHLYTVQQVHAGKMTCQLLATEKLFQNYSF